MSSAEPGLPHVDATVRKIAELARAAGRDYTVRQIATKIVKRVPGKDYVGELRAINDWVRNNIAYRKDPHRLELVQAPLRTIQQRAGDCDDMTALLSGLAQTLGHGVMYRTVGPAPSIQKHVHMLADVGGRLISLDPVLWPRHDGFDAMQAGPERRYTAEGVPMSLGAFPHPNDPQLWRGSGAFPVSTDSQWSGWVIPQPDIPHIDEIDDPEHGMLGADDFGRVYQYDGVGSFWSVLKKVGSAVSSAVRTVASSPIAQMAAGIIPGGATALRAAGTAASLVHSATSARSPAAAAAALASRALPAQARALLPAATGALRALAPSAARAFAPAARPTVALPARGGPVRAGVRVPVPAVRARYPVDARQIFDAAAGLFRVYIPVAASSISGLSGLGWITEAEAFASPYRAPYAGRGGWGLGDTVRNPEAARSKAPAAIAAIKRRLAAGTQRTPDPEVRAFQVADGALTADGLYGANTRAALAYYAPAPAATLPARPGATWRPPGSAPAPAPRTSSGAPAGFRQVGTETQNPGLPPVPPGAPTATAPPSSPVAQPAPPVAPAFSTPEAEERAFAPPDPFARPPAPPPPTYTVPSGPAPMVPTAPTMQASYPIGPAPSGGFTDKTWLMLALFFWVTRHHRRS